MIERPGEGDRRGLGGSLRGEGSGSSAASIEFVGVDVVVVVNSGLVNGVNGPADGEDKGRDEPEGRFKTEQHDDESGRDPDDVERDDRSEWCGRGRFGGR